MNSNSLLNPLNFEKFTLFNFLDGKISKEIIDEFESKGFTPSQILLQSNFGLFEDDKIKLKKEDIQKLLYTLSINICGIPKTLSEIIDSENEKKILFTTNDNIIDKAIGGGFSIDFGLCEIAGEAGTGKTQFCLHLLSCLPKNCFAFYVSTEHSTQIERLSEIAKENLEENNQNELTDLFNRIYVNNEIHKESQLNELIFHQIPNLCDRVKLVIIDSIASIFRSQTDIIKRSSSLLKISNFCKYLSKQFGVVFIFVNQVTSIIQSETNPFLIRIPNTGIMFSPPNQNSPFKPSLGLVWSNCINSRIMLYKTSKNYSSNENLINQKNEEQINENFERIRKLEIVFSPILSNNSCNFLITKKGLKGI
ncbi:DNA repair protein rad57 [Anaeramoeba ignava]|uniref:DNA repair protein rad57 n=1 Tax=Anaeramoeba ignava TaxID=1746090 RepID=A0A9Q0L5F4_ANAIG|nr:DNA repair protein rad57 [Anaeramoeba ignava]